MCYNVFVYGLLRGLARNLAIKNRIENPRDTSTQCELAPAIFISRLELAINYIHCSMLFYFTFLPLLL